MKSYAIIVVVAVVLTAAFRSFANEGPLPPGDAYPVIVQQVPPDYPPEMKKKRVRGEVTIELIVESDGSVRSAKVVKQTNDAFGGAALACVKKWTFKPGLKAGIPVRCLMQVPIIFQP